jgi:poly-gamma-glutamate synthesis protein (capsule biosynthesis protein)
MKIGFLAATDVGPNWLAAKADSPGILLASDPNLSTIIANAKKQVDVLVMSFHWGTEYSPANAHQESLAHQAVDAGADIIVGSHPHVMERIETYKGKPIFYSLGDFIFDQYFSPYTMEGMVATVFIDPETKELTSIEKVSPLDKNFVPQVLIPFDESMLVTKTFIP